MTDAVPFQLSFSREIENFTDPRVSVALATYNGAKYITEQLESIKHQTKTPYELVVVDDGSSDHTLEILNKFAETAPFAVRVFKNERNLGYQRTFFKAAAYCQGDLIAFSDQDDVWLPNKLEVCSAYFTNPEILLCFHMGEVWHGEGRGQEIAQKFDKYGVFEPFSFDPLKSVLGFSMVLRKSLLGIVSDIPLPSSIYNLMATSKRNIIGHDGLVWFLASVFGNTIIIPETLVLYRQHEKNTVGSDRGVKLLGQIRNIFAFWDLTALINLEREFINFLKEIGLQGSPRIKLHAEVMVEILSQRIEFQSRRLQAYRNDKNILTRTMIFFNLLRSGDYSKSYCFDQFNKYARTKDIIFGVLRLGGAVKFFRVQIKSMRARKKAGAALPPATIQSKTKL